MRIKENCHIIVDHHPYADSLKEKLRSEVELHGNHHPNNTYYTNIVGKKLEISPYADAPSGKISKWAESLVRECYHYPNSEKTAYETAMWFSHYDKGDYAHVHHHLPFAIFSWVYFVNCPRGSSPLRFEFSGRNIKAEEGKIVIFPSVMRHGVPKNRCNSRLTLVGNMISRRVRDPNLDNNFMPGSSSYSVRGHYTVNLPL
jgi:hypothetical protein